MPRPADMTALLCSTASDHLDRDNIALLDRWTPVADWMAARLEAGFDASCKSNTARIGPRVVGRDRAGRGLSGLNFAMQDALSLASHPRVLTAASAAARRFGVHAAGSATQMGLSTLTTVLEDRLAMFLACEDATVFPCGWTAGFGVVRTLMREGDHILIDAAARDGLQEGARASGARVHVYPHGGCDQIEARLEWLRDEDPQAGILVIAGALTPCTAEGLPDLARLQRLCRRHAATLLVDVSHDLGMMGDTGRGAIEMQRMLGRIDILVGSFARAFAANGGFVASSHPALKAALRLACGAQTDSNALSPVQAAVALAALEVITSEEGAERRARLAANADHLRAGLRAAGFAPAGQPGPVVTLRFSRLEEARRLTAEMLAHGALVNLDEGPLVAPDAPVAAAPALWRLKVMADHAIDELDAFVALLCEARARLALTEDANWIGRYAVA